MDYKKVLEELEKFAQDEYSKLADEFPLIEHFNVLNVKSSFLGQELNNVRCKITFNYPKIHVLLWHGNNGGGHALMFDDSIIGRSYSDEECIERIVKWKTAPFSVKTKTIKFSP